MLYTGGRLLGCSEGAAVLGRVDDGIWPPRSLEPDYLARRDALHIAAGDVVTALIASSSGSWRCKGSDSFRRDLRSYGAFEARCRRDKRGRRESTHEAGINGLRSWVHRTQDGGSRFLQIVKALRA
jgi:hypothetical protein